MVERRQIDIDRDRVTVLLLINSSLIKKAHSIYVSIFSNSQTIQQMSSQNRQQIMEQYNNINRRVQCNLSVLSYISDSYHNKAAAQQPNRLQFPVILSSPPEMPELRSLYKRLQDLYPDAIEFLKLKIQQMKQNQDSKARFQQPVVAQGAQPTSMQPPLPSHFVQPLDQREPIQQVSMQTFSPQNRQTSQQPALEQSKSQLPPQSLPQQQLPQQQLSQQQLSQQQLSRQQFTQQQLSQQQLSQQQLSRQQFTQQNMLHAQNSPHFQTSQMNFQQAGVVPSSSNMNSQGKQQRTQAEVKHVNQNFVGSISPQMMSKDLDILGFGDSTEFNDGDSGINRNHAAMQSISPQQILQQQVPQNDFSMNFL